MMNQSTRGTRRERMAGNPVCNTIQCLIDRGSVIMTGEEIAARTVMERCNILGSYSEEPDCLTRPFASRAMRRANEAVATWMQTAGMTVHQDAIGNLIGRYEARSAG